MTVMKHLLGVAVFITTTALAAIAFGEPNTGGGAATHDCAGVQQTCGAWGAKGANTCRSCQQAQCKTENGKDVLAGNKTTTECYEGHGAPPAGLTRPPVSKMPPPMGGVLRRGVEGEQPDEPTPGTPTTPGQPTEKK